MLNESILIEESDVGLRLDKYLSSKIDVSRSQIQRLIEDGLVLVNDESVKTNYKLREDDEISITYEEAKEIEVNPEDIPLNVVFEDDHLIVLNKPKGIVVHPGPGNYEHTLVNALLFHCKNSLSGINGYLRPGIVHRIDKDTSGLLVVAKDDKTHIGLSAQLADKTCFREYYALLEGVLDHDEFTVDAPIGRSKSNRQIMTVTDVNSKEAVTHFEVMERHGDFTVVKCRLETGRTHQIRVHSKFIKHPVVNDPKYGKKIKDETGQMLHAYKLSFIHPITNERMTFETEMPEYMKEMIQKLDKGY